MLRFRISGLSICLDFSFFLAVSTALLVADELIVYSGFLACAVHEAGHLLAMLACGIYPEKLKLYGGGICIFADKATLLNPPRRVLILLSGAAVNLAFFAVFHTKMPLFAAINLIVGLFNLLPFQCFDGGAVIALAAQRALSVRAYRIYERASAVFDCLITILLTALNIFFSTGGVLMTGVLVYTIILQLYQDESE